jgi:ethanolamine ammonia-lyase small subunit
MEEETLSPSALQSPPGLREYTSARVALERAGSSLATRHTLEFALAHAQARDAVHSALDVGAVIGALGERRLAAVAVSSAAAGRTEYLRRPDLGRRLSVTSASLLAELQPATDNLQPATSLSVVLADGLSALATQRHAVPLMDSLLALLDESWALTPIVVAEQARVALGDEVGALLRADVTVMLIGERPGLSSPDSLGAYITWNPRVGRTDAERNCVSNIRPQLSGHTGSVAGQGGLDYATAAQKIAWYIGEGRRLGLTGVALRESDAMLLP